MSAIRGQNAVDLWRRACADFPAKVAIRDQAVEWTYRELANRAGVWSAEIVQSIESSATVAIHLPHSSDGIAALLGTLMAGKAFVPLDPAAPIAQRLAQLQFCDAAAVACRAEDETALRNAGWSGAAIFPESLIRREDIGRDIQPDSIAFYHFTSGSSGSPKAVALPHRTATCAAGYLQTMFGFTPTDRHALLSPLAVPATTAQVLAVLSTGATLCLLEARSHSAAEVAAWLGNEGITTAQTVPSLFRKIGFETKGGKTWPRLRVLKLGGEPATADDARLFAACTSENAVLINGLGLTEAGFNVCWWKWHPDDALDGRSLPVGRPPTDLELVIEASPGTVASDGEEGEIVVRSPALPNGYWRDPERSSLTYRDLPDRAGWRELRTGDIGRWRCEGILEYLGRCDDTVKVRGHRVAPAEVEAALSAFDEVTAAAVVSTNGIGSPLLQAFVQLRPGATSQAADLRRKLAEGLPSYMVPAHIQVVDALPHLSTGKIDRITLSKIGGTLSTNHDLQPAATDVLGIQLLHIWQEALGAARIGIKDDFFALGGDSLAGVAMLAAVEKLLGINLPSAALLEAPTIEKLAELIRDRGWTESDLRMVAFRLGGGKPALYCVTGAGCDVLEFRALAKHLGDDQPVFAFQPRGLDGHSSCQRSVEEMAESYIAAMQSHQPRGPYCLCGNSFGGVVAFEMARRLVAAGEKVKFLGLFDSYGGKYPERRQGLSPRKRLKLGVRQFLPFESKDIYDLPTLRKGLQEWMKRRLIHLRLFLDMRAPQRPYQLRFLHLQEASFIARRRYQLKPLEGKIHLFRAEYQPPSDLFRPDPFLGWNGMAADGVEFHNLSGHHGRYLREPGVAVLAGKLTSCLAGVATAESASPIGAATKVNKSAISQCFGD